jgi:hypothetical protein
MRVSVRQFPNHGCFIPAQYLRFPGVVHGSQRGAGVLHRSLHFLGTRGAKSRRQVIISHCTSWNLAGIASMMIAGQQFASGNLLHTNFESARGAF